MAEYVAPPTAQELLEFLGWSAASDDELDAQAAQHAARATALVRSYTRGRGFHETGAQLVTELRDVALSAAGRSLSNPTSDVRQEAGQWSAVPGQPDWTLQERLIMDGYRRRAA